MSILATIGAICSAVISICTAVAAVVSVANSLVSLAKSVGLIDIDGNGEDVGARALYGEEQGITPEAYDYDYDKYSNALNELDMTNVDQDKWSVREKAEKAIEVSVGALQHTIGPKVEKVILAIANEANDPDRDYFSSERAKVIISEDQNGNIDAENAINYMEGRDADATKAREDLCYVEKTMKPDISDSEALDFIDDNRV